MSYAMIQNNALDNSEWPALGRPTSAALVSSADNVVAWNRTAAAPSAPAWSTPTSAVNNNKNEDPSEQQQHDDSDWENLQPLSPPPSTQRPRSVSIVTNVVMVDMNRSNPKVLRRSASSPDMRQLHYRHLAEIGEEDEENDDDSDDEGSDTFDAEASSFAVLSGPGSVVSFASGVSFRDVILSSPGAAAASDTATGPTHGQNRRDLLPRSEPRKPRSRPRIVVQPIRRCSKSTGDLQSLAEVDEDAAGHSDAMDFYNRKWLGAKGRANGLKMRPDELKRKQFTMQKKEMQRQQQGRS
jgi:hypothetical protein